VPARNVRPPPSGGVTTPLRPGDAVIGYVAAWPRRADGVDEGAAAIEAAVDEGRWRLIEIVRERDTRARSLERPGLAYALERIAAGEARGLVISDLRNLCRSIIDLASLVDWFRDAEAALIALDLRLDTGTPAGEAVADVLLTLGAWEHERIARRTRAGLADAAGRAPTIDASVLRDRVAAMRAANMTLQAIADALNAEGVPTMRGGARWRPSSVQGLLGYRRPSRRSSRETPPGDPTERM
jgi:DNA invertase Pin-like site-specific DNA recombinase